MLLIFDKIHLNPTYFKISCWYKIKKQLKWRVYNQFEHFWFYAFYKKHKNLYLKPIKNYLTKSILIQFISKLVYVECLKILIKIKFKKYITKDLKIRNYKCYFRYVQKLFQTSFVKFRLFNVVKTKVLKKKCLKIKILTAYKSLIYSYLLNVFENFYINKPIKSINLNSIYFYLLKIKNRKKHNKNKFSNLFFFRYNGYITCIYKKNLRCNKNVFILRTKQRLYTYKVYKTSILLIKKPIFYFNKYATTQKHTIKIFTFYVHKLKYFSKYYSFFYSLKNKIYGLKNKKLLNILKLIYIIKNKMITLNYFSYNLINLIFDVKRNFKIQYVDSLTKHHKYLLIKKKLNFF